MKPSAIERGISSPTIMAFATAAMATAIFVFDTLTDLEIAVSCFYVVVVLMSVTFCQRRGIMLVSAGCLVLAVASYFINNKGLQHQGLINSAISLTAIGATSYLALKIVTAEAEVQMARERLEHVSRVLMLGELTASISHEINQPLAALGANAAACARWIAARPPNLEEATQAADRIVRDANRASGIVAKLRSLAKRAPPERTPLNINDIVVETIALAHPELRRSGVALHTELADRLPPVAGDAVQLQQVMLNLILNAVDAIRAAPGQTRRLTIRSAANGRTVELSVQDEGIGVKPEMLPQIFEGFYTTKAEGMGMGLTISRSIVEAHGGHIWATAAPERGTVLQVRLPTI